VQFTVALFTPAPIRSTEVNNPRNQHQEALPVSTQPGLLLRKYSTFNPVESRRSIRTLAKVFRFLDPILLPFKLSKMSPASKLGWHAFPLTRATRRVVVPFVASLSTQRGKFHASEGKGLEMLDDIWTLYKRAINMFDLWGSWSNGLIIALSSMVISSVSSLSDESHSSSRNESCEVSAAFEGKSCLARDMLCG